MGVFTGLTAFGYNKVLHIAASLHPEIFKIPDGSTVYAESKEVSKEFTEYKDTDQGYSMKVPKGYTLFKTKEDPSITINDEQDRWEITIKEKLLRYDATIQSTGELNNPEGDYYVLLERTLKEKVNPFLLFQKITHIPSTTKEIKTIITPHFPLGFLIIAKSGNNRLEVYRMFDDSYWHNIFVTIKDPKYPHYKIETIIASLKNDVYKPKVDKEDNWK
jgi:hypothetical protein